jgi:2-dehydro-3-deoxygluconokinase
MAEFCAAEKQHEPNYGIYTKGCVVRVSEQAEVVTFGESMVVFWPTETGSLEAASHLSKGMAGAESNVAIGLARLGHRVAWLSCLGDDGFGRFIYKTLRGEGVDVSRVQFDPRYPTGIYFKEKAGGGRTNVQYYRRASAASTLGPEDVRLGEFPGAKILFVTGITPALSESCRAAVFSAIDEAHARGMKVVFDPNVRYKLWSPEEATPVLLRIAEQSDVVLPGIDEAGLLTGIRSHSRSQAPNVAERLLHGRTELVAIKLGPSGAYYLTHDESGFVPGFEVEQVDEIGAGDAFASGIVSGLLQGFPVSEAVRWACALGAFAVTGVGDYESLPYRCDMEAFLNGESRHVR